MILDTTVLIDLQRELRRDELGPASRLLEELGDKEVAIAFVTSMEFAEGYSADERESCDRFLSLFRVLWPDADTAWQAARIARDLRSHGRSIGDHDAWIAGLALQHDQPVATANDRHFKRVPKLSILTY
jgi:predicted nucleic acid-binding protein